MKLTPTEKTILKNLDSRLNWIARDNDGNLWVYLTKPTLVKGKESSYYAGVDARNFPFSKLFTFIEANDEKSYKISELLNE